NVRELRQAAPQQRLQVCRQVLHADLGELRGQDMEMVFQDVVDRAGLFKGEVAGEQLIQSDADAVQVAALVDGYAPDLLGADIVGSAAADARCGALQLLERYIEPRGE